jgi:uncharacterized SAM-binding protein YcdF (DUF218 family)
MNRPDALIILNGGVESGPHGPKPNHDTQARINHGLRLAQDTGVKMVAMVGRSADIMAAEATQLPMSDGLSIACDSTSGDTLGNAHFSKVNLVKPNTWSVEVVTADYHVPRVARNFERVFGHSIAINPAPTSYNSSMRQRLARRELVLGALDTLLVAGLTADEDDRREQRILTWMPSYDDSRTQRLNSALRRVLSPR